MASPRMAAQRQRIAASFGPAPAGGHPAIQRAPKSQPSGNQAYQGPMTQSEGEALEQEMLAMLEDADDAPPSTQPTASSHAVLHFTGAAAMGKPPKAPPPRSPGSPEDH